jgi:hypothetical protein
MRQLRRENLNNDGRFGRDHGQPIGIAGSRGSEQLSRRPAGKAPI